MQASAPFSVNGPVFAQQVEKEIELSKIRRATSAPIFAALPEQTERLSVPAAFGA